MNSKTLTFTRLTCAMVAVTAAMFAAPVSAAPAPAIKLYGGGATLPANAYLGSDWLSFNPAHRLSDTQPGSANPASATSLFAKQLTHAYYPARVQYCQTGSGTGRGVITGAKPDATSVCGDYSGPTPNGFSAVTARANFAASDAPFSSSDVSTFATNNAAYGSPVQFPAVAGAIAVVYNNASQVKQLNLTESQICRIFAGQITDWKTLNSALPSKPIKLVVRSDSSGTTFSFMNHLSAVCPTAIPTAVSGFSTQSTFVTGAVGAVLPAGTIASSGNGGVIASIAATDGAIGYAEASDTKARKELTGASGLNWATVSKRPKIPASVDAFGNPVPAQDFVKFDPFLNSPTKLNVSILSDKVIGANDGNGRPTVVSQTPVAPAAAGCLLLVDPNTYATASLTVKGDYTKYPIVAVSYLMGYYSNNQPGKLKQLQNLLASPYTIDPAITTIGTGTGFSWISVPTLDTAAAARVTGTPTMTKLVKTCLK